MNDDDNLIIADPYGQDSWGSSATVITNSNSYTVANSATTPTIQGKMLTTKCEITQSLWEDSDKDAIKHKMIHGIVEEMIKSKCIEFTSLQAPNNDYVTITARIFVTPDDQVRLLRKAGY